jgi:hypothetical protein
MTRPPEFDELVGADVAADERARLRRVHDLLVTAGPPPELPPELESPTLAMTLRRARPRVHRRTLLLAAAVVALALAFLGGYVVGNGGNEAGYVLRLRGNGLAPAALASLRVEPADSSGNWPMRLSVTGLPKLPAHGYYEVYLVRSGRLLAPCGRFLVHGPSAGVSVPLNAPYRLEHGDSWVITRKLPGEHGDGTVVMRPLT